MQNLLQTSVSIGLCCLLRDKASRYSSATSLFFLAQCKLSGISFQHLKFTSTPISADTRMRSAEEAIVVFYVEMYVESEQTMEYYPHNGKIQVLFLYGHPKTGIEKHCQTSFLLKFSNCKIN